MQNVSTVNLDPVAFLITYGNCDDCDCAYCCSRSITGMGVLRHPRFSIGKAR